MKIEQEPSPGRHTMNMVHDQVTSAGSSTLCAPIVKNVREDLSDTVNKGDAPHTRSTSRRQSSDSSTLDEESVLPKHECTAHTHGTTGNDETLCAQCRKHILDDKEAQLDSADNDVPKQSHIVTWDGPNDPHRPMNWSPARKWTIVITSALMTFTVSFGSSVFSATVEQTGSEFDVSSEVMLLGVALYVVGFALGPMVWGPASELYGRTLPLWAGMVAFCIFQIPLGVAQDLQTIFIVRFFAGFFGSAPLAILAGMYVDFLPPMKLGISIACFSAGVFCGPALGPIIGAYITESYLGWRWIAWITMIAGAVFTIICFCFTPETYEPVLLRRKAARLRIETQDFALHAKCEETPSHPSVFVTKYLTKPIHMLIAEPILIILTVYCSLVYGILYLTFEAYPISFIFDRGWSATTGSLPFLALLIGILLACVIIGLHSFYYVGRRYIATDQLKPEDRLPTMILGSILLPVGLFWFAWTADPSIHWPAQVFAGIFIGCGIILIFMSAVIFLVDVYLLNANSALAINTFVRSIVAAGFPMFATYMYEGLGVDWATSVLGFVCVALVPFPLLFWRYGKKIRSWSKYAVVLPEN